MEPTMHELLVKTRNEIDKRGHAKGILEDPRTGAVCLYGGFFIARHGTSLGSLRPGELEVQREFANALGFEEGIYTVLWNNAPERTKEEVLARLDEAITRTAPAPEDPFPAGTLEPAIA